MKGYRKLNSKVVVKVGDVLTYVDGRTEPALGMVGQRVSVWEDYSDGKAVHRPQKFKKISKTLPLCRTCKAVHLCVNSDDTTVVCKKVKPYILQKETQYKIDILKRLKKLIGGIEDVHNRLEAGAIIRILADEEINAGKKIAGSNYPAISV